MSFSIEKAFPIFLNIFRVILETVLWTQCSSHNVDAFVMFFCLLKCDMDNCCVIINVCILYLYMVQVRLLVYL